MKMRIFSFIAIVVAFLAACTSQPSKTFTIEGTAVGFNEGDTLLLLLSDDFGIPSDTIVVGNEGKFTATGKADSVVMCTIYEASNPQNLVQFFSEPATIRVELTKEPGQAKISGSLANDSLQAMIETMKPYAERIGHLMDSLLTLSDEAADAEKWVLRERMEQLYSEQTRKVVEAAERNIDNELGYYIVTHYDCSDPTLNQRLMSLIDQMPPAFQQRSEVMRMRQADHVEGFTLPTPDGGELNVMDEISKHQLTLLDFWASWCGPCRQEMPFMVSLYERYQPLGLGIVGISLDEEHDAWVQAIADLGITWPQMSDLRGWQSEAAQLFHVQYIPYIVIVDQQGNILAKDLRGEKLEQFVSQQLGQ